MSMYSIQFKSIPTKLKKNPTFTCLVPTPSNHRKQPLSIHHYLIKQPKENWAQQLTWANSRLGHSG